MNFREELRKAVGGCKELPDDWAATANATSERDRKVLGGSSGQRKETKDWMMEL